MEPINTSKWVAIGAACVMLVGIFYAQHAQINSLRKQLDDLISTKQQYVDALEYQNKAILDNMQDVNKTKALPTVLHDIQVKYRNKVIYADRLRDTIEEDKNESAIDSVIKYGSSIDYWVQQ